MEVRSVVFGALDVKFKVDGWPCLARRSVSLKKKKSLHIVSSRSSTSFQGRRRKREDPGNKVAYSCINGYLSRTAGGTQGMD